MRQSEREGGGVARKPEKPVENIHYSKLAI